MEAALNSSGNTFGGIVMGVGTSPMYLIILAIISSLMGMIIHWYKLSYKDGEEITFIKYFFVTEIRKTLYAALGVLSGLFVAFAPIDYTTISAYQVILQAFSIGYASDSIFNSSTVTSKETDVTVDTGPQAT